MIPCFATWTFQDFVKIGYFFLDFGNKNIAYEKKITSLLQDIQMLFDNQNKDYRCQFFPTDCIQLIYEKNAYDTEAKKIKMMVGEESVLEIQQIEFKNDSFSRNENESEILLQNIKFSDKPITVLLHNPNEAIIRRLRLEGDVDQGIIAISNYHDINDLIFEIGKIQNNENLNVVLSAGEKKRRKISNINLWINDENCKKINFHHYDNKTIFSYLSLSILENAYFSGNIRCKKLFLKPQGYLTKISLKQVKTLLDAIDPKHLQSLNISSFICNDNCSLDLSRFENLTRLKIEAFSDNTENSEKKLCKIILPSQKSIESEFLSSNYVNICFENLQDNPNSINPNNNNTPLDLPINSLPNNQNQQKKIDDASLETNNLIFNKKTIITTLAGLAIVLPSLYYLYKNRHPIKLWCYECIYRNLKKKQI